jgi:serine/threonine protein kinase
MKVTLSVVSGPERGRTVEFDQPRHYVIGRAKSADLVLPAGDPYAGRRHVLLEIAPPAVLLIDLHSTNPPHVNGIRVHHADLRDGDELELGYTRLRVGIDAVVTTHVAPCGQCGGAITVVEGDNDPALCSKCAAQPARHAVSPAFSCRCHSCGANLDDIADSDGQAADLGQDVLYCCEKCLPEIDRDAAQSFHGYRTVRLLGKGGMGNVYLAHHSNTGRLVAIKALKNLENEELIRRFTERDTRYTAEFRHPSLVRYIDRGFTRSGAPFLVMQYLPDGSLDDAIEGSNAPVEPQWAARLIASALEGLAYVHDRQIIHRDITPGNILLDHRLGTETGFAKLTDFGLAYCYARAGGTVMTAEGTRMGTMMFMSPEQVRDPRQVRESADIYSMGVTFYHLLTGAFSLDFPSAADLGRKLLARVPKLDGVDPDNPDERKLQELGYRYGLNLILDPSAKPIPVRVRRPDLPPRLAEVIDRSVCKTATDRYASAKEMRNALLGSLA